MAYKKRWDDHIRDTVDDAIAFVEIIIESIEMRRWSPIQFWRRYVEFLALGHSHRDALREED
jgi:hypothetical protein